ncbi:hypothetical protein ABIE26_000529 [Pedobacter africanus]|uniref:Uncharacterized protein n=1 Tax=Pedobacter africanus TaxID=151894 RepID=A0ACC6KUE5_9SPHI|nr:DUF6134 family protein [Pedobacter africanus]MDR6782983.1 hypothetical protein [Pedobacter africanus]
MKTSANNYSALKILITAFLLTYLVTDISAQEKRVKYNIIRNDNVIGQMQFSQKNESGNLYLTMTSLTKTRFVFNIEVNIEERAHFQNGQLISSSVQRRVNGKEKANKQTRLVNNSYQLHSNQNISRLNQPIRYNLMMLYANEPSELEQVYSDNYQQFLDIKRTGAHTYRIQLPDGNYNDYHFANGLCHEIIIHNTLYTIKMQMA